MNDLDFDAIFDALFQRIKTELGANIKFSSRRYLDFDQIEQTDQPAMLCVGIGNRLVRTEDDLPAKHYLRAMVILYVRDDQGADPTATAETEVLALVKLVRQALKSQPGDGTAANPFTHPQAPTTTLGGLVKHTWVTDFQLHQGAGSGQAGATVTVELLTVDDM